MMKLVNIISKTIQDAMEHNMKLVMIRPEFVSLADQMIKEYDSGPFSWYCYWFPWWGC